MTVYDDMMRHQRETGALAQVAGRLGWDQETVMPQGAGDQRAEEGAAMEAVLHARRTDPRIGAWLDAIDPATLDDEARAQIRHIRRSYDRAMRVPADLATALARLTSRSHQAWARARADDDVASFLPVLSEIVALKREEGAALAAGGDPYDAMLQDYEPGTSAAQLGAMFDALRPRLVALRQACLERPQPAPLTGRFDAKTQMALSRKLAGVFGYDFSRGRIDKAVHPFSSGSGDDVRITTRTSEIDPFNCAYTTIHEVGHATYEQAIRPAYRFTPLGEGVSMGVHESQSRIYENQLGRSRAFTAWLHGEMTEAFGDLGLDGPEAFYAAVNRLENGFIRTEADEVQYNLHVLLRFDLERALISGDLSVGDLEAAWNDRFAADFGFAVDRPSNGVLQDVHWSAGLFGYFATYTLGNVYAGCLHERLRDAVPDLDAQMAAGDLSAATGWLRGHVQQHGGLFEPREVITRAYGRAPDEGPLLAYLEAKFGALYGL
ncbi:peptidase M32 [Salipiger aestuarii]|uniref:Metal-dependent carboxypeptidase n=2 Tax=Salipiger aestuarii TaxID=568098 RepID=A0A327Y4C1_9RHOB|nr:carboxypeptidase M32 [Salipiger aestuarii]EIE51983.1 carboxypeptidase Taq [Citreicella sp. 357]KAB2541643.1 peptidase M32 [Salipiger aestuarii]RAK14906.1 carboxypeptidase Taq [Salipiger aestuarii]